jgi:hypothetical protein
MPVGHRKPGNFDERVRALVAEVENMPAMTRQKNLCERCEHPKHDPVACKVCSRQRRSCRPDIEGKDGERTVRRARDRS